MTANSEIVPSYGWGTMIFLLLVGLFLTPAPVLADECRNGSNDGTTCTSDANCTGGGTCFPIPIQCQIDVGCSAMKQENGFCPNDETGQKDLTQFCVDPGENTPFDLHSKWNWDEVNGFSGGNTGDACTLYDTDSDGNINYAICVTITDGAGPGVCSEDGTTSCNADNDCSDQCVLAVQDSSDSPRLFLCGDGKPDRCTEQDLQINQCRDASGATPAQPQTCAIDSDCTDGSYPTCGLGVCKDASDIRTNDPCVVDGDCGAGETCDTTTMGPYKTQCEVNSTDDDPFDAVTYPNKGPGDAHPIDTEALCWIDLQDFNGSDARLIDACSFPSRQANSDPSDCILFQGCSVDADCADQNECTADTCNTDTGFCVFTPVAEGTDCGGAPAGVCDIQDTCSAEGFCTDNGFEPSSTVCRVGSGDSCDPSETCTGSSADCPTDVVTASTVVCNEGSGDDCDPDELCTGCGRRGLPGRRRDRVDGGVQRGFWRRLRSG